MSEPLLVAAMMIFAAGCRASVPALPEAEETSKPDVEVERPAPVHEPVVEASDPEPEPEIAAEAENARVHTPDPIRRIVRANIEEVRSCYIAGLKGDPELRGRVMIEFVIGGNGRVASSVVAESTLTDPDVGECIAAAALGWLFPRPVGGGNVIVRYPFNLVPG